MKLIPKKFKKLIPFRSANYWEQRYAQGGTSGAGSYGRLAAYKADFINDLANAHMVSEAVEFGSGDGNQCGLFNFSKYTGIDVSQSALNECRRKFKQKRDWKFFHYNDPETEELRAPLVLSLDVIFHLVEDQVFSEYMKRVFDASTKYVLVYSSDHDAKTRSRHVRHRAYSTWVANNAPEFSLEAEWPHPFPMTDESDPNETSFAHFKLFKRAE
jgi:hypothetical protein